jgi:diguanylate cyclase (GGDEF)-like protein
MSPPRAAGEGAAVQLDHRQMERLFGTFFDITSLIHAGRERDAIFARVLECACELLDADMCSILLVQDGNLWRSWRTQTTPMQQEEFPCTKAISAWLERERQPFLGPPGEWHPPADWQQLTRGARALVCAPLVAKESHLGLMIAVRSEHLGDFEPEHLKIITALANQTAIALENAELYERLHHEAVTDGLTGVYNYKTLMHTLRGELRRAQRYGHEVTFIMADVDYLKRYNDRFGHMAGSEVLAQVARLLTASCRNTDIVGKYGGDEFAVILPQTSIEGARNVAERMRAAIAEFVFDGVAAGDITCSFGLASFPQDGRDIHALVCQADQALFRAKRDGKNMLCTAEAAVADASPVVAARAPADAVAPPLSTPASPAAAPVPALRRLAAPTRS